MPAELVIPLAIFLALLAMFALLIRRIGLVVRASRQEAAFRKTVRDLAKRVDATLAGITNDIDALRRRQIDADEITEPLDRALAAVLGYSEEAQALEGPAIAAGPRAALAAEIDRADRALHLVEHGSSILTSAANSQNESEAQTAIKRGYLNLLHAREAIARHAAAIIALRPSGESRWLTRRRGADR